ncbi:hypothetical protein GW17_00027839 [Ensete ventricosum]|nr:hypothetical protein GW17_00027839 [Ensete ventricosum]
MAGFQLHLGAVHSSPPSQQHTSEEEEEEDEEEEDEEEEEEECPISSPLIVPRSDGEEGEGKENRHQHHPFSIMAVLVAALRKSLVMCSVGTGEDGACRRTSPASMEIGWPSDVQHVAHVTFDRFDGFLGLPVELEPEVPRRVPSARSVFSFPFFVLAELAPVRDDAVRGVYVVVVAGRPYPRKVDRTYAGSATPTLGLPYLRRVGHAALGQPYLCLVGRTYVSSAIPAFGRPYLCQVSVEIVLN